MPNGDIDICNTVRATLEKNRVQFDEQEVQHGTKFLLKVGAGTKTGFIVFSTGKIHVDGAESELKKWAVQLKAAIESGGGAPGQLLPLAIEMLPETLKARVPSCDPVIVWFFEEALRCYKAGSTAGAAFMLGAASEKSILLLIELYGSRISDDGNREKFLARTNNRMISVKYDEFKRSYKSATPKPTELLAQDLEQLLDGSFHFYRHCRNAVGHPQIVPDLEPGVVLANLAQFVTYIERIYALISFYQSVDVAV